MKNFISPYLLWVIFALINSNVVLAQYSNATLNGPWYVYTEPLNPYNDNLMYFVFDGKGTITATSGFPSPMIGTYSVNASGVFSGILNVGSGYPFSGQLTSATEGTGNLVGQSRKFHKIANPGVLQDKISGPLTTQVYGSRNVTLNIDSQGNIISATGLTPPVSGRIYADLGVFLGHLKTGDDDEQWRELSIMGLYSDNNLIGKVRLDAPRDEGITSAQLVRSDNLKVKEIDNNSKAIIIYPNPNNGKLHIDLKKPKSKIQVEIYNVWGQKIYESTTILPLSTNEVNFAPQSKGVYLIKINDGENNYTEKILIQ